MGSAMLAGWLAAGVSPSNFTVVDPNASTLPDGVKHVDTVSALTKKFGLLLLSVKPQMMADVATDVAEITEQDATIISVMAGVQIAELQRQLPGRKIIRLMPNLSVSLGLAPLGLCMANDEGDSDAGREEIDDLLSPLGQSEWLDSEDLMDAFTALAGSGPAFVYRFIDALAAGGIAAGLPEDQAQRIAQQMTVGAAQLSAASDSTPAELAQQVTSPGGTTAAGLDVMDENGNISLLMKNTLRAARDRGAELAKQAREQS